jgi:hypothetical protein
MESQQPAKSWLWTWARYPGVVSTMDDDTLDLIVLLCTRVGIIMEDMSVIALTIRALDVKGAEQRLLSCELLLATLICLLGRLKHSTAKSTIRNGRLWSATGR